MTTPDAPPTPEEFALLHPLRVRWAEVDPQGIVFNPNYFTYFDLGMTEYMRAIGLPYPDGLAPHGTDIFAVNATANFRASARFDEEIRIGARAARLGTTSLRFRMAVFRGAELLVDGEMVYVNAARDGDRRPTPLPDPLVERILAFEKVAPERK
ncbi:MAG TPA: thioesterase family protein [Azospirillaceae bacterium]|nr:thioesterase family protein [Azospirillaceae bacterium]